MKKHSGKSYKTSQGIVWKGQFYKRVRSDDWRHKSTGRIVKSPTISSLRKSKEHEPTLRTYHGRDKVLTKQRVSRHLNLEERRAFERLRKR